MEPNEKKVLFQKLGDVWYVFARARDGLVYSPLPRGADPRSAGLELYEVVEGEAPPARPARAVGAAG